MTETKRSHIIHVRYDHFIIKQTHHLLSILYKCMTLSTHPSMEWLVSMHVEWLFLFQILESFNMYRNKSFYWSASSSPHWFVHAMNYSCTGTQRIWFIVWTNQLLFLLIHYSEPVEWLFLTRHRETLYVQMHTFREGPSKQYMYRHVLIALSVGGVQVRSEHSRVSLYARVCP